MGGIERKKTQAQLPLPRLPGLLFTEKGDQRLRAFFLREDGVPVPLNAFASSVTTSSVFSLPTSSLKGLGSSYSRGLWGSMRRWGAWEDAAKAETCEARGPLGQD